MSTTQSMTIKLTDLQTHRNLARFRRGQIKTGRDKVRTGQKKSRQVRTGREVRQVTTGKDRSGQLRTCLDMSGVVRLGQSRLGQVRTEQDRQIRVDQSHLHNLENSLRTI